jgi:hypothetical protein
MAEKNVLFSRNERFIRKYCVMKYRAKLDKKIFKALQTLHDRMLHSSYRDTLENIAHGIYLSNTNPSILFRSFFSIKQQTKTKKNKDKTQKQHENSSLSLAHGKSYGSL